MIDTELIRKRYVGVRMMHLQNIVYKTIDIL